MDELMKTIKLRKEREKKDNQPNQDKICNEVPHHTQPLKRKKMEREK